MVEEHHTKQVNYGNGRALFGKGIGKFIGGIIRNLGQASSILSLTNYPTFSLIIERNPDPLEAAKPNVGRLL